MKKSICILGLLLFAQVMMAWVDAGERNNVAPYEKNTVLQNIASCAPVVSEKIQSNSSGKFISILPGWGNYFYKISTSNDSAQLYFNQGLTMYYSYHPKEALASFKEASRFDSTCAMLYWAQALALGPTYNYAHGYAMSDEVPRVIEMMNRHKELASAKEKELMTAMAKRYAVNDINNSQRSQLNAEYADAMQPLAIKYTDDPDVQALYIDARMLMHPWDFWSNDGTAKSWTPELVKTCEDVLRQSPTHPAGLHYYIHLTEASRKPEVALANADALLKLFPGVAHMVHMSSHEYERIGHFEKGVQVNEAADKSLGEYALLEKELKLMKHSNHYYAVGTYCALSGAMYQSAMGKATMLRNSVSPSAANTYDQYLYMFPEFVLLRMGRWQEILDNTTTIPADWSYAGLLHAFARGMAYAKTGKPAEADECLAQLRIKQKDGQLKQRFVPHMSSPYEASVVAEYILLANIKFSRAKYKDAVKAVRKAVLAEDKLIYTEPKLWMLPARQYLGAFYLQLKQPAAAEKIYRQDLLWNPGNGWSLLGLYQSLEVQNKVQELQRIKDCYLYSFSAADSLPVTSAY